MKRPAVQDQPSADPICIRLSRRDRDLILQHTFIDGELKALLGVGRAERGAMIVDLTPHELDELLGYVAAEANHSDEPGLQKQLTALYDRLASVEAKSVHEAASRMRPALPRGGGSGKRFTREQGQYLAYIYYYTKIHGQAPAQADLQQYFKVSPPSVHQMVLTLERRGLIARQPGQARSLGYWWSVTRFRIFSNAWAERSDTSLTE